MKPKKIALSRSAADLLNQLRTCPLRISHLQATARLERLGLVTKCGALPERHVITSAGEDALRAFEAARTKALAVGQAS